MDDAKEIRDTLCEFHLMRLALIVTWRSDQGPRPTPFGPLPGPCFLCACTVQCALIALPRYSRMTNTHTAQCPDLASWKTFDAGSFMHQFSHETEPLFRIALKELRCQELTLDSVICRISL